MEFRVTGMTCAACAARVEKAIKGLPGVKSYTVNLLTNTLVVEGPVSAETVMDAVRRAGYDAVPTQDKAKAAPDKLEDTATKGLLRRLIWSAILMLPLMYLSMGYTMWGLPLPAYFQENPSAVALVQLLLTVAVMVVNQSFFTKGFSTLLHGSPNMDTLVALGSSAAFIYSTYQLFAMLSLTPAEATKHLHDMYFESAGMILTLITLGKMLEARSKGRTTDALRGLMELAPRTATLLVDGEEQEVPADQVPVDAVFVVKPGATVPVDGVVLEGESAINEAALTGESIPVDKGVGDTVSAATINQSGYLRCRATRVGEQTTLSQIIKMVETAAATKAPIAKAADTVSGVFVPVVLGIATVTLLVWLLAGQTIGFAIARAISVLVISCPCALALATPMAIMVGSGLGARNGILFKTAAALEQAGRTKIVALDKTGTITAGQPQVTDVVAMGDETALLSVACALEQYSEHPLGGAVRRYGQARGIIPAPVSDFCVLPGNGLTATLEGIPVLGGNEAFIRSRMSVPDELERSAQTLAESGKTPLYFASADRVLGILAVADTVKEDSASAIRELKEMGIRVVMLTGDNRRTAEAIGRQVGVDEVFAEVLPEDKEALVSRLMEQGPTAMVGDGINDAPALTRAHTGIAIGAGTDVAIDAADVVLMHSRLSDVPAALRLSRGVLRNIRTNLFWAFFYNSLGIPLAAGVFIPVFGWYLSPMVGAAAMCLSDICVATNALRLNWLKLHPKGYTVSCDCHTHHHHKKEEETSMELVIKVEGMMCPHCEANVKSALEEISGVDAAVPSHVAGTVTVTMTEPVDKTVLRAAIEAKGYKTLD